MQLNFEGKTKDEVAIERIKTFEPPEGYTVLFSLGIDSQTVHKLCQLAKVKFELVYCQTGIDPPEAIYNARINYPELIIAKPKVTMWQGIAMNGYPTRLNRWCCRELKEWYGGGKFCITGIRAEESIKRRKRQMVENCIKGKGKKFLHPIIDWRKKEVWEFARQYQIPYCNLYDKGWARIGCIGCPQGTLKQRLFQLAAYPKIAQAYYRAAERYVSDKPECNFRDAQEMWDWWLSSKSKADFKKSQDNPMFL